MEQGVCSGLQMGRSPAVAVLLQIVLLPKSRHGAQGWSISPMRKDWESWGCSAWRREGCGETLEQPFSTWTGCRKDEENIFSRACCDRARTNGFKLREGRFRLDIRRKFFMVRMVKHWNRMPREVVEAPSLETFKARSDRALSKLVWLKMSLLTAGGLG